MRQLALTLENHPAAWAAKKPGGEAELSGSANSLSRTGRPHRRRQWSPATQSRSELASWNSSSDLRHTTYTLNLAILRAGNDRSWHRPAVVWAQLYSRYRKHCGPAVMRSMRTSPRVSDPS